LNTPTNTPPLASCIAGKVPQRYEEDPALGVWVNNQRACFKNRKMDQERKEKLDEIGFDFFGSTRGCEIIL
jgi:hypothetical protein